MGLVLDTSAYIGILAGDHQIAAYIRQEDAIIVPAVVIGELIHGYRKGSRFDENHQVLWRFLESERVVIAPLDYEIAVQYGELKQRQLSKGSVLADNDLWIAANSLHLQIPLLTLDSDFDRIENLDLLPV